MVIWQLSCLQVLTCSRHSGPFSKVIDLSLSKRQLKLSSIQINGERLEIAVITSNEGVFGNEVLCATFCDIGHTSVILYCLRIQMRCSNSRCRVYESAPGPEAFSLKDKFLFFIATRGESYLNLLFKTSLARGYQSTLVFLSQEPPLVSLGAERVNRP